MRHPQQENFNTGHQAIWRLHIAQMDTATPRVPNLLDIPGTNEACSTRARWPTRRIAGLYGVPRTILHQRVLGKHQYSRAAHRDEQLFSTGEVNAVAEYAGIMADAGFPLSPNLLWQIAQGIINEREISQHGQGGGIIGPRESSTKQAPSQAKPAFTITRCSTFLYYPYGWQPLGKQVP